MEALAAFLRSLLIWLRIIPEPDFLVQRVADRPPPDSMNVGVIYVVGGKGYQKWACFRCPADKDEIVQLSLMPNRRPLWQVSADFLGRPSIHPSIWQHDGSYAHFWIKRGRVIWCADNGDGALKLSRSSEN